MATIRGIAASVTKRRVRNIRRANRLDHNRQQWENRYMATATEIMMRAQDEGRLARRDYAVAQSLVAEMLDKHFKPTDIEDMRDVRRQMARAIEDAAFLAIQKERELHAGEVAMVKAWLEARVAEDMLKPRVITIPKDQTQA